MQTKGMHVVMPACLSERQASLPACLPACIEHDVVYGNRYLRLDLAASSNILCTRYMYLRVITSK